MSASRRSMARLMLVALPVLGALFVTGCEDAYDDQLLYPLRKDWIVTAEALEGTPTNIDPPGLMPLTILDGRSELQGICDDLIRAKVAGKIVDPRKLLESRETAEGLMLALRDVGGRPRYPKIDTSDDDVNAKLASELKLDRKTLEFGSQVYRRQCLHCHGLSGDGRGPTGGWINPHPRDFRSGAFKYTSSGQAEGERKPRREDLRRVLTNGIEGSAMPSFMLLKSDEMEAVISYVIHLSIRGEAEVETMKEMINELSQPMEEGSKPKPIVDRIRSKAKTAADRWLAAQSAEIKPVKPPEYKNDAERLEAAARGYKFFIRPDQCVKCHTNFGRDADLRYDTWGTIVRPRNLISNQFGGGRRPIDFFWRLHSGLRGAGMPAMVGNPSEMAEKEGTIWDLVAFIQTLPYPEERAKLRKAHNIFLD